MEGTAQKAQLQRIRDKFNKSPTVDEKDFLLTPFENSARNYTAQRKSDDAMFFAKAFTSGREYIASNLAIIASKARGKEIFSFPSSVKIMRTSPTDQRLISKKIEGKGVKSVDEILSCPQAPYSAGFVLTGGEQDTLVNNYLVNEGNLLE